jgi:hypothetical protein
MAGQQRGEVIMKKRQKASYQIASIVVVALAVAAGGFTFMYKLYEFIAAAAAGYMPGMLTATVLPYFFISTGFLLLAAWAWLGGHFKNIEGPKRDMLHQQEALDRAEREHHLFY